MTWHEAVAWACPDSLHECLRAMEAEARRELERGRALFDLARKRLGPDPRSAHLGVALACCGAALDLVAASIQKGRSGNRELLLGDGLLTRSLTVAAALGRSTLLRLVALATEAMGTPHPSATMRDRLVQEGLDSFLVCSPPQSNGGSV